MRRIIADGDFRGRRSATADRYTQIKHAEGIPWGDFRRGEKMVSIVQKFIEYSKILWENYN